MTLASGSQVRLAARCRYLRLTFGGRPGELTNICQHIIRDGRDCVGPFLEDHETQCGLWEEAPGRGFAAPYRG